MAGNRKSSRHFDLDKPKKHSFDLDKGNVAPVASTSPVSSTSSDTKDGGKKTWLWILLALLVLAAILVFALRSCNKDGQSGGDTPTEQVIDAPAQGSQESPAQGTQDEPVTSETPADNPSAAGSDEPATPEQTAQPATGGTAQPTAPAQSAAPARTATTPAQPAQTAAPARNTTAPSQPARQTAAPRSETPHVSGQLTGDIETDAKSVIRGEFGNGAERRAALGERYGEIQRRVDAIYREKYGNN